MLKRIKPSRCKICCRVHEHENPYLLIIGDERKVYFQCRRAPEDRKLLLGKLKPDSTNVKEVEYKSSPEQEKINTVKVKWTTNVVERVQELARSGKDNGKKYVSNTTPIEPRYRKELISMYVNYNRK